MRIAFPMFLFDRRRWQAPRRLRLTRAGWLVTIVSLALGLAAIQSGNNPLFFLWGTILGGIVLSGVLSEACLRPLCVTAQLPSALRVGEPAPLALFIQNASRVWPAFALSWSMRVQSAHGARQLEAPYVLRLDQRERRRLWTTMTPRARGLVRIEAVQASTAYPFGLFVKERPFDVSGQATFVRPRRVPIDAWLDNAHRDALGLGRSRQTSGDDFGMLRAFRTGDPLRRVLWRRAAATGRWLVAETQSERADSLVLLVQLSQQAKATAAEEAMIERAGSLAESLVERGIAVGLWTHGAALPATHAPAQVGEILDALARVHGDVPFPKERPLGGMLIAVSDTGIRPVGTQAR